MKAAATETLIGASEIAHRVEELARDIVNDFGDDLSMLVLVDGGFVFAADLLRALGRAGARVEAEFLLRGAVPGLHRLEGRRVLVVDAAIDTGRSALTALDRVRDHAAAEVRLAVLVDRPSRASLGLCADYVGFILPDRWLVGYGLAQDGQGRERADIAALD